MKIKRNHIKKILFIVNTDWFFLSHRLPIALAAQSEGYEVHLATKVTSKEKLISSHGIYLHDLPIARSSSNPLSIINSLVCILFLVNSIKPDIIHSITIKPVLLGGIVSRIFFKIKFVASISGLGYVFIANGIIANIRLKLVKLLYILALGKSNIRVIFQNKEDKSIVKTLCRLPESKTVLIRGSGVDLNKYHYSDIPNGKPIVLFASRLLISKGILQFVNAARLFDEARFLIAGDLDADNPDSINIETIRSWESSGFIEYCGFHADIQQLISKSSIVVLPSYYGEGLPKILIEAAACGRPIITTDHPGCRDALIPNHSGLLVPKKDINSLVSAINILINDKDKCSKMGKVGRQFAEKNFSIDNVIEKHLNLYLNFYN